MAEIVPFRGILYEPDRVGDLSLAVAPPYDVISPAEQGALYAASPYNYVRVILNRSESGDDELAPYRRAADVLNGWLAEGVLAEDEAEALYHYRQEFTNPADGRRYSRNGLFVALKLEPYSAGVVLPHELTRTKAKEDRLRLMRATRTNPEPIYALYEDPAGETAALFGAASQSLPDLSVTVDGDLHEIRRVHDPRMIDAFRSYLSNRRVWIADGHHRYETGLAYQAEKVAETAERTVETSGRHPYDYILTVLTPFEDRGLVVLPTHRLLRNIPPDRMARLISDLERDFDVSRSSPGELEAKLSAAPPDGEHRFGLVLKDGCYLLNLRNEAVMDEAVKDHSDVWKRLDVSILQTLVLERVLGIPQAALATTPDLGYTRDWDEAFDSVATGEFQAAFLLAHPRASEVREVAVAGDKMPPKSTFFYPKLWSGLVLRRL